MRRSVLEPFLAGVLAEDRQETSRRFVDLLLRAFARGVPALPADGIRAVPRQLASRLPDGCIRADTPVHRLAAGRVSTPDGDWSAPAVVVAADPVSAAMLCSLSEPKMRALTTLYFHAPRSPVPDGRPLLHVDGERRGPVVNSAVVSDAAPGYCRDGALVQATVLGAADSLDGEAERRVRRQLAAVYGCAVDDWALVASYPVRQALPAMLPPLDVRQQVSLGDGLFVAGDHRDTASIQGALASGRRAGRAVVDALRSRAARRA